MLLCLYGTPTDSPDLDYTVAVLLRVCRNTARRQTDTHSNIYMTCSRQPTLELGWCRLLKSVSGIIYFSVKFKVGSVSVIKRTYIFGNIIDSLQQELSKLNNRTIHLPNNVILSPVDSAHNLGVIFDNNMSFAQHISPVSKSCFHNIRDLRHIRNTIDQTTQAYCLHHSYFSHSL